MSFLTLLTVLLKTGLHTIFILCKKKLLGNDYNKFVGTYNAGHIIIIKCIYYWRIYDHFFVAQ